MKYDPAVHHRRSIRLRGYDYSRAGAYFVTICIQNRECLFGEILDGKMLLNGAGRIVAGEWNHTTALRTNVELDEFVIMPNHIHGVVVIVESRRGVLQCKGVLQYAPTTPSRLQSPSQTIGAIVRGFKSAVTKRINELRETPGAKLWQRNYWEHIVRNESELNRIRAYIQNNPAQWEFDKLYSPSGLYGRPTGRPNQILEPSVGYGRLMNSPNDEAWMT